MHDTYELLYVYIKEVGRYFYDTYFTFTNEFNINYDPKLKKLKIEKKYNVLEGFYGENISSINLIVGPNGAGKTTLFNLIGSYRDDRYDMFKLNYKDLNNGWFALYKTENDGVFYIEGFDSNLILNSNNPLLKNKNISRNYSLSIDYDYQNHEVLDIHLENSSTHGDKSWIFYDRKLLISPLLEEKFERNNREDYSHMVNRSYIQYDSVENIYRLSNINNSFFDGIINKNMKIIFKIDYSNFYDEKNLIHKFLDNINHFYKSEESSVNERFACSLLYGILIYFSSLLRHSNFKSYIYFDQEYSQLLEDIKNINQDLSRLDLLMKICQLISRFIDKVTMNEMYSFMLFEYIEKLKNSILSLDEKYFKSEKRNETFLNKERYIVDEYIQFDLGVGEDMDVCNFLSILESGNSKLDVSRDLSLDFKQYMHLHLSSSISEGELALLHICSGIYYSLMNVSNNQKSAIILLDEPDKSLHPKWISSFIKNLVELVRSLNNGVRYQFIISTHSPFMISDVPKEFITCIDIAEENGMHVRKVKKPKKSFASNFYDIIQDSFFLDKPVGEYAFQKINQIMYKIKQLSSIDNHEDMETDTISLQQKLEIEYQNIYSQILLIDDDYIRSSLLDSLIQVKQKIKFNKSLLMKEKEILENYLTEINRLIGDSSE